MMERDGGGGGGCRGKIERTIGVNVVVQMTISSCRRRKVRTLYLHPAFCVFPEVSHVPGEWFIE